MLMLSGIQHFMFCPRQWALIHIEQQWDENRLTAEGKLLHTNVDNPLYRQKNGDTITLRAVHVASRELGLYGITDAVELIPSDNKINAITHNHYTGYFKPYPIEYKRGSIKYNEIDEVQLVAQIMCLEEMYGISIERGALYYGELRHREEVMVTDSLRALTMKLSSEMHEIYKRGVTPIAEKRPCCRSCSLCNLCMPEMTKLNRVSTYLRNNLYEETS